MLSVYAQARAALDCRSRGLHAFQRCGVWGAVSDLHQIDGAKEGDPPNGMSPLDAQGRLPTGRGDATTETLASALIDNVSCSPSDVKNDLIIDDSDLERRHGEKRR